MLSSKFLKIFALFVVIHQYRVSSLPRNFENSNIEISLVRPRQDGDSDGDGDGDGTVETGPTRSVVDVLQGVQQIIAGSLSGNIGQIVGGAFGTVTNQNVKDNVLDKVFAGLFPTQKPRIKSTTVEPEIEPEIQPETEKPKVSVSEPQVVQKQPEEIAEISQPQNLAPEIQIGSENIQKIEKENEFQSLSNKLKEQENTIKAQQTKLEKQVEQQKILQKQHQELLLEKDNQIGSHAVQLEAEPDVDIDEIILPSKSKPQKNELKVVDGAFTSGDGDEFLVIPSIDLNYSGAFGNGRPKYQKSTTTEKSLEKTTKKNDEGEVEESKEENSEEKSETSTKEAEIDENEADIEGENDQEIVQENKIDKVETSNAISVVDEVEELVKKTAELEKNIKLKLKEERAKISSTTIKNKDESEEDTA